MKSKIIIILMMSIPAVCNAYYIAPFTTGSPLSDLVTLRLNNDNLMHYNKNLIGAGPSPIVPLSNFLAHCKDPDFDKFYSVKYKKSKNGKYLSPIDEDGIFEPWAKRFYDYVNDQKTTANIAKPFLALIDPMSMLGGSVAGATSYKNLMDVYPHIAVKSFEESVEHKVINPIDSYQSLIKGKDGSPIDFKSIKEGPGLRFNTATELAKFLYDWDLPSKEKVFLIKVLIRMYPDVVESLYCNGVIWEAV